LSPLLAFVFDFVECSLSPLSRLFLCRGSPNQTATPSVCKRLRVRMKERIEQGVSTQECQKGDPRSPCH
jgi:hypothetical protein